VNSSLLKMMMFIGTETFLTLPSALFFRAKTGAGTCVARARGSRRVGRKTGPWCVRNVHASSSLGLGRGFSHVYKNEF
jgi:hypothetical protein